MQSVKFAVQIVGLLAILTGSLTASDWPTWRHDAARTATTDEQLPDHPTALWSRELGPNHVAWQEDIRLQFDASYEPIVVGKILLVASARTNSVSAYRTETGEPIWQYHVSAPVRLAPFAHQGHVYFGADDGKFYCLDVATGTLSWSVDAAPSSRLVLGNERLISAWPVRGGVVVHENRALFTVGVWPFEGCFVCEVNVDGGPPVLKSKILEDMTPQGHLALAGGRLFIPTGRGNAKCLDSDSLAPVSLNYSSSKGLTDSHVTSSRHAFFHGDAVYDIKSNTQLDIRLTKPVLEGSVIFGMRTRVLKDDEKDAPIVHEAVSYDLDKRTDVESRDRRGNPIVLHEVPELWSSDLKGLSASDPQQPPQFLLKAGHQLIGVQGNSAFALNVTNPSSPPSVLWQLNFSNPPRSAIAADGKLFITTTDGTIHCFGAQRPASTANQPVVHLPLQAAFGPSSRWTQDVAMMLQIAPTPRGQCIVLGGGSGALIEELLQQSRLTLHILEPDTTKAMTLRARLAALGVHGQRANVFATDLQHVQLPPYLATLIVSEELERFGPLDKVTRTLFPCLRPYGGSMIFRASDDAVQSLSNLLDDTSFAGGELTSHDAWQKLTRVGPLPGAADWSHEYGDPSNTLMSHDELVKAPLGVLWFGGPASQGDLYFDRHYWGPGLTVVEGRMIVQGPNKLTSIDIYTGEILWQRALRNGSGPGREGNFFDGENPGFHFVATQEFAYLVYPDMCLVLNSQTGATVNEFHLPQQDDQWGKIRIWKDLLLVTVFQQTPQGLLPRAIQAMNRHTGAIAWRQEAHSSVPLLAIGGDRVYCFDGQLQEFYDAWKRRGLTPETSGYRALRCFDVTTGKQMWERTADRVATWMSYSPDHDILVVSNKQGIDALQAGDGNG
ncbi:MAG: PQQ-binding-like beta-propeller repeat protein, partial [Planctomycetota bacterium]|nr:PQQ-binding-like beta-propeller repeat protein [Planctomycetota bacterium]